MATYPEVAFGGVEDFACDAQRRDVGVFPPLNTFCRVCDKRALDSGKADNDRFPGWVLAHSAQRVGRQADRCQRGILHSSHVQHCLVDLRRVAQTHRQNIAEMPRPDTSRLFERQNVAADRYTNTRRVGHCRSCIRIVLVE